MTYEMRDVKIITVVLGSGGELCAKFFPERGEIKIWPNEQSANAPDDATHYGLVPENTEWSMMDSVYVESDPE